MKYFIDTEFIEGFHKPLFGKRRHHVDLISIGIYCEDGRSYYAISKEYNYDDADSWVKENVIIPMYRQEISGDRRNYTRADTFHKAVGKSNKQIAEDIMLFVYPEQSKEFGGAESEFLLRGQQYGWNEEQPDFYGYYADYDWVVFCSLFGRMIDLPKGFPMYCRDLKQMLDDYAVRRIIAGRWVTRDSGETKQDFELRNLKAHPGYPQQTNEHNALADAKWNYELYKFLGTL